MAAARRLPHDYLNITVSGLEPILTDAFDSLMPQQPMSGDGTQQTLTFQAESNFDVPVTITIDYSFHYRTYQRVYDWVKFWDPGWTDWVEFLYGTVQDDFVGRTSSVDPARLTTDLTSVINYNFSTEQASLGDYKLSNLWFTPDALTVWDDLYDSAFKSKEDAWWLPGPNPYSELDDLVSDALKNSAAGIADLLADIINTVLNGESKQYIDESLGEVYNLSWDRQEYPSACRIGPVGCSSSP